MGNSNASKLSHNVFTPRDSFLFLFFLFSFYSIICIDLSYYLQRGDYDTVLFSQVNGSCVIFISEGKDQGWAKQNT